jgi:hypothetical protein
MRLWTDWRNRSASGKLGVLPAPGVGQVLGDQFAEAQTFVQLAHQNQTAVGSDLRTLEIDPQEALKRS